MNLNARDHMANERTFLSWIRTSIGIMIFGFVVEKFNLFIKHFTLLFGKEIAPQDIYASYFGIGIVLIGLLISLSAFIKYRNVEEQLNNDTYKPSRLLGLLLTVTVLIIGGILLVYLLK